MIATAMTVVIKGQGANRREPYSSDKLHKSIAATCRSLRCPDGQAEQIAHAVTQSVEKWLHSKPVVTSSDIRRQAARPLAKLHQDAAYLYQHQADVL